MKAQHLDSLRVLRMHGRRNFDLETNWLPDYFPADDDDDSEDREKDDGDIPGGAGIDGVGDDPFDSSDDDADMLTSSYVDNRERSLNHESGARRRQQRKQGEEVSHGAVGSFSFFLGSAAPLLVGKVKDTRQQSGQEEEVLLHWYTPSKTLVANASSTTFDTYAGAIFNAAYRVEVAGQRKKSYVEDMSWEPKSGIVATCPNLISGGKKIPSPVKKALKSAARSQGQPTDEQKDGEEGGEDDVTHGSHPTVESSSSSSSGGIISARGANVRRSPSGGGGGRGDGRLSTQSGEGTNPEVEEETGDVGTLQGKGMPKERSAGHQNIDNGGAGVEAAPRLDEVLPKRTSTRGLMPRRTWAEEG